MGKGTLALATCIGANALDDGWRVWRCLTCGLVAAHRVGKTQQ
jgi:hypothetical protein